MMMGFAGTLLLNRQQVASLLNLRECISAVEGAFRLHGEGKAPPPGILGMPVAEGGFHLKAGLFGQENNYFACKMNGNFPKNPERRGLPTIQGIILLADATNGLPLAVMDSTEITVQRTGAATAVAARFLSRADSQTLTLCGCGNQGRIQLQSLLVVRPIRRAYFFDVNGEKSLSLAREFSGALSAQPISEDELSGSLRKSDICVTCTPSRRFFVHREDIARGTFIAAVGADSIEKQELDPGLFNASVVVADVVGQSASIGDLHHAIVAGEATVASVHAELGEIVAGRKPGRRTDDEVIIFDSTGMALQDAAAAVLVYERAVASGIGNRLHFN